MNKDLYGKKIELPEDVVMYLQQCHDNAVGADDSTEGYRRNKELRDSGFVTYQQLKRIKNFFDNFQGQQDELPFILNGGHYVKGWVNRMLDSMRKGISIPKEIRSEVLPNQYIDTHTKDDVRNMNRPLKSHSSKLEKYNLAVTEDLKRINDLIKKII